VEELDRPTHGQAEGPGQVVVGAGVTVELHDCASRQCLLVKLLREHVRHAGVSCPMMQLQWTGEIP